MAYEVSLHNNANRDIKYIGVALPMIPAVGGGFARTTTTLDQARFNILNLIQTEKGERIFRPEFGVSIKRYIFENFQNGSVDIDDFIVDEIKSAIKIWLPYVTVTTVKSLTNIDNHSIEISLSFYIYNNKFDSNSIQLTIDLQP